MNLLGNTTFALDSCKLSSNASKEQSGTFKDLTQKKHKLEQKIQNIIDAHTTEDTKEKQNTSLDSSKSLPEAKQKSIKKMEHKIQKIEKFLAANKPKIGKRNKESQSNMTDNKSSKMKTGHGVIQGYNGQTMVDAKHQVIVAANAFEKDPETSLLKSRIEETKENFKGIRKDDNDIEENALLLIPAIFQRKILSPLMKITLMHLFLNRTFVNVIFDLKRNAAMFPIVIKNYSYKTYHTSKAVCSACPLSSKCLKGTSKNSTKVSF